MTCALNWIIVRERRAESISLFRPDLAGFRGKTVSGHLELSPDAVDDHDFCCVMLSMLHNMQLPKQTLHNWNRHLKSRYAGFVWS